MTGECSEELVARMIDLIQRVANSEMLAGSGWHIDATAILAELKLNDPLVEAVRCIPVEHLTSEQVAEAIRNEASALGYIITVTEQTP